LIMSYLTVILCIMSPYVRSMLELNLFGVPSKDNLALISFVNGDFKVI
jgi:hypothetical protein